MLGGGPSIHAVMGDTSPLLLPGHELHEDMGQTPWVLWNSPGLPGLCDPEPW